MVFITSRKEGLLKNSFCFVKKFTFTTFAKKKITLKRNWTSSSHNNNASVFYFWKQCLRITCMLRNLTVFIMASWMHKSMPSIESTIDQLVVSELIPNYVFHCMSLHWVSAFLHVLLNHLSLVEIETKRVHQPLKVDNFIWVTCEFVCVFTAVDDSSWIPRPQGQFLYWTV